MRAVIIGSGLGGLAAAIRLAARGHDVTIVERRDRPGGRASSFARDGFTFDAGPTIVTAPQLIDELFTVAERLTSDYVDLVPLDPFYTVRFDDGSSFRVNGDEEALRQQIRSFRAEDEDGYRSFAAASEKIFEAGFRLIDRPFHRLGDFARVVPELLRLRADRSVAALAERHLRDKRLRQVFSFHPLLIGGNPFSTTSIYALIHPLEKRWGVWFPMGGMRALVAALVTLFGDLGGTLRLSSGADAIMVDERNGRARGVRISSGETIPADVVVSNADVLETHRTLLPERFRIRSTTRRMGKLEYSMSVFMVYFGTDRRYDDVGHHEILMGPRYRELLREIFVHKRLATDFSLYLYRPTATDPSLAPAGGDTFYALSPVPNLSGNVVWEREAPRYRDSILEYLERRRLPDLRRHIVTASHVDPRYFRDQLATPLGSAFSIAPSLTQSAWFRPHNVSALIPNLYFVGAGTHPGAGIPGVLSSAKIVERLISEQWGQTLLGVE